LQKSANQIIPAEILVCGDPVYVCSVCVRRDEDMKKMDKVVWKGQGNSAILLPSVSTSGYLLGSSKILLERGRIVIKAKTWHTIQHE